MADAPAAYWRLDDLIDSSGNSNTLTVNGSVPTTTGIVPGDTSLARTWSGSSANYLTAVDSTSLDVGDTFSIEAWVKVAADPAVGDYRCIISKDTNSFWFGIHRTSAGIEVLGVKYGVAGFVTSSIFLTVGIAYHLVVTKSGDATKLWVNGIDRTGTTTAGVTLANNASQVQIGRSANGSATPANEPFNGVMDDIAIFPTVLDATKVQAHYAGSGAATPSLPYFDTVMADNPRAFYTWT